MIASHSSSTTTSEYFTLRAIGIITTYEVFTLWLLRALYVRRRVLNYFLAHIILINVETTTTRLRVCIRDLSVCPCSFWQLLLPPLYAIVLSSHTWYLKPLYCRWLCYQGHYNTNFIFLLSSNNNKAIYQLMLCSGTILCRKTGERFLRPISAVSQLCLVINTVIGISS